MKVLPMTDALFVQRRRVMNALYEARRVIGADLPRIKVRIVDFEGEISTKTGGTVFGRCFIKKDYITISKEMETWSDAMLRHIVWHELGHAYFNAKHDPACPLMRATVDHNNLPPVEAIAAALRKLRDRQAPDAAAAG